jgi:hypothetical protein
LGKIFTSSAAAGEFVQTIATMVWEYFSNRTGAVMDLNVILLENNTDPLYKARAKGMIIGELMQQLFGWTVPVYRVNEFGKVNSA